MTTNKTNIVWLSFFANDFAETLSNNTFIAPYINRVHVYNFTSRYIIRASFINNINEQAKEAIMIELNRIYVSAAEHYDMDIFNMINDTNNNEHEELVIIIE